ncbi:hypothetical protein YDYSY3_18610 [Paenibacillus chitinolyticus]|nr:hypothetical protein YDYSY3_18610 [Paenibacillus chitinolyticus]
MTGCQPTYGSRKESVPIQSPLAEGEAHTAILHKILPPIIGLVSHFVSGELQSGAKMNMMGICFFTHAGKGG